MNISIIGLGLIGGSLGLALRDRHRITGCDRNPAHQQRALELGLVHDIMEWPDVLHGSDIVVLCVPVDAIRDLLPMTLDRIPPETVVIDTGSTKRSICSAVHRHPQRRRFVACHPIAGTEFSGPDAAMAGLFQHKTCIVVDPKESDDRALEVAETFWRACGTSLYTMTADAHDRILAYASHLPHAMAFALARTVGNLEAGETIAGSGLAGAVRLARSSPETWSAIFSDNSAAVVRAIDDFIRHLDGLKTSIRSGDSAAIKKFLQTIQTTPQPTGRS